MKKYLILLISVLLLLSCESGTVNIDDNNSKTPPDETNEHKSIKGHLEYKGRLSLQEGPHDLLIVESDMFAVRDHRIWKYALANPAIPTLQKSYALENTAERFGKLYSVDNKLYITCQTDGLLYEFDKNLILLKKYSLGISNFKPNTTLKDAQGNWWIGGSNGSRGILAKYNLNNNNFELKGQWTAAGNDSNIESMIETDTHIIASIPKGELLSFKKTLTTPTIDHTVTFQHEAGHEKWGHTVIKKGNEAFWANWGAGFASVNISNPSNMIVSKVLTNSAFKTQFNAAEGTNVYDVAYNSKHDLLCIANGWSGVLILKPSNSAIVHDFIDPSSFQNRCIASAGDYIYTGNISGGTSGDLKGILIFKIN